MVFYCYRSNVLIAAADIEVAEGLGCRSCVALRGVHQTFSNKSDHVVMHVHVLSRLRWRYCSISPWVMTRATSPLLCIRWGGNFSLQGANQTSDFDYRGSASHSEFLWDHQNRWWAKSLSQCCDAFSEADGVFWALVWTKRWHYH